MIGPHKFSKNLLLSLYCCVSIIYAKENNSIKLGVLQTGSVVSFVRTPNNKWGIEIKGGNTPKFIQNKPAVIEIYQNDENISLSKAGYSGVKRLGNGIEASAEIKFGDLLFRVKDRWSINDSVLSVNRKVKVNGNAPFGFNSSISLNIDTSFRWSDINIFVPGALYGDPSFNGERSVCGTMNYNSKSYQLREDILPAPLVGFSFNTGFSVAMLDPTPDGESTVDETKLLNNSMTDDRFKFGSFGIFQKENCPVEFGFYFPGSTSVYSFIPNSTPKLRLIRRYHPTKEGIVHNYNVEFKFSANQEFHSQIRNSWRWAWNILKPKVNPIDVELVRRVLINHLASQAAIIDGRVGIPFAVATYDTNKTQWNATMTAMGFVSKNIECADQLLRESSRDNTDRGKKMRQLGLGIISSMINALSTIPLEGTGYDLATGKPWTGDRKEWLAPWLRNATEDMRALMRAYQREKLMGFNHADWINWVLKYADWLILQQREDGSFPRRWKEGTSEIIEPTGSTSYCPVPLLVILYEETKNEKYKHAALKAAEYIWENFGKKGLYVGGASDNPNITDKEAGMLSIDAFLSLYDLTKDNKWLVRAKSAADYTETWMWIWNLPMPIDADNSQLHWKKGIPTIGLQGITARGPGGVDEYMDWSASSYTRLYKLTNDQHYLEVAKILLHNTKAMVALPGRLFDMKGVGWQQEHWRMGPGGGGRGVGGHRFWLPWVSANHLYSITGIEEIDPLLFAQLSSTK